MDNLEVNVASLIFDLLITLFIYMFVPITLYIIKKELKENEPKKIAIINSIVGFIIFVILFIVLKKNISLMNGIPAFFYGYINYKLLKSMVKKEVIKYPNEEQENENLKNLISSLEEKR